MGKGTAVDNRPLSIPGPMSERDFAAFGMEIIAYVRPAVVDGVLGYAVHAADGTPITMAPVRSVAFAAARQQNLDPVSVH